MKFLVSLRSVLRNYSAQLKAIFHKNKSYRKLAIITTARTGSNLLMSLLNGHSNIEMYGEIFKRIEHETSEEIYTRIFGVKSNKIKFVGFKIFYYHPENAKSDEIWDRLASEKDIVIIHLKRNNLIRSYVSAEIAEKTNRWRKTKYNLSKKVEKKISIDPNALNTYLEKTNQYQENIAGIFSSHLVIDVSYEALVADQISTIGRLFKLMDLPFQKVNSKYLKQNPEKLSYLIRNYSEIRAYYKDSEYLRMLEK